MMPDGVARSGIVARRGPLTAFRHSDERRWYLPEKKGARMISRRIVVQGFAALTAGLAWRPAWAVSRGNPMLVPTAVSSRMSDLAD